MGKRGPKPVPVAERIRSKLVSADNGCLVFTGKRTKWGYGMIWTSQHMRVAHRVLWEVERGPIDPKLELDHLCRNRACCNLDHLEIVTHRENTMRGVSFSAINALKTHCAKGHEFTQENTYYGPKQRHCRTCARELDRARYKRGRCFGFSLPSPGHGFHGLGH
jgi:hypothetical protein